MFALERDRCLIESHYLPSVAYLACIAPFDTVVLERHEYFIKQTYRNRCHIATANGIGRLTVPLTSKHGKVLITDVKVDYNQKWLNMHWRTIESAYRNAPFYEHYADDLRSILFKRTTYLYELNSELLTICLKWLGYKKTILESASYEKVPDSQVTDRRNRVDAKNPALATDFFTPVLYHQVFGREFEENMSLIDLVFCEGPNARTVVESSARVP